MAVVARLDRRKADSRQRLMAAARALFIERGYHATRPQDIARAADVGHGTFYLHFADKRACFLAFAEEARRELERFMQPRLAAVEGVEGQIRTLLIAVLDYAEAHPGVLKAAMTDLSVIAAEDAPEEMLADRWAAAWAQHLKAGAARGAIHADYDPGVIGHAVIGLIQGATRHRKQLDREALIDNVTRFLVRALVPPGADAAQGRFFTLGDCCA
jgi:AcrR family transcriptional regulator